MRKSRKKCPAKNKGGKRKSPLKKYQGGGNYSGWNPTIQSAHNTLRQSQMMPQSAANIGAYDTGNFDTGQYFDYDRGTTGGEGSGISAGQAAGYAQAAAGAVKGIANVAGRKNAIAEDYVDVAQDTVAAVNPWAALFHGLSETGSQIAASTMGKDKIKQARAKDISGYFWQPHTLFTKLATGQTEEARARETANAPRLTTSTDRTLGNISRIDGSPIGIDGRPIAKKGGLMKYIHGGYEKVYGRSHEKGGIKKDLDGDGVYDAEVEGGEIIEEMRGGGHSPKKYIWSDHLKTGGMSFAKKFEKMQLGGASEQDIDNLRVEQEIAAGRDPGLLFAKYGGMHKYKGGGIHIDPAKRGTFKAQATRMGMGVQEAASKILNASEGKYSPAMRKKANFAKNFAKRDGGIISYQSGGTGDPNRKMYDDLGDTQKKVVDFSTNAVKTLTSPIRWANTGIDWALKHKYPGTGYFPIEETLNYYTQPKVKKIGRAIERAEKFPGKMIDKAKKYFTQKEDLETSETKEYQTGGLPKYQTGIPPAGPGKRVTRTGMGKFFAEYGAPMADIVGEGINIGMNLSQKYTPVAPVTAREVTAPTIHIERPRDMLAGMRESELISAKRDIQKKVGPKASLLDSSRTISLRAAEEAQKDLSDQYRMAASAEAVKNVENKLKAQEANRLTDIARSASQRGEKLRKQSFENLRKQYIGSVASGLGKELAAGMYKKEYVRSTLPPGVDPYELRPGAYNEYLGKINPKTNKVWTPAEIINDIELRRAQERK